jgi:putative endonuclease
LIEKLFKRTIEAMSFRDWFASAKRKADGSANVSAIDESELAPHLELGRRGEKLAAIFLESEGYTLVASNFILPVGRNIRGAVVNGEIDIIAYDGPTLCFVEVKTRTSDDFAAPEQSVDRRKQRQITRAARAYRRMFGLVGVACRYDVVSIILPKQREDGIKPAPRVELLKNFWTDAKFRKHRWSHDGVTY